MARGTVPTVPDDGKTTRQRRTSPLVVVHSGAGKGKSTAAFGLALRGWNQGWSIGVFQFVKSAKWRIGEQAAEWQHVQAELQEGRRLVRIFYGLTTFSPLGSGDGSQEMRLLGGGGRGAPGPRRRGVGPPGPCSSESPPARGASQREP